MAGKKILYIINHVDWFWSHRLPLAIAAKHDGWDVHVAVHNCNDPRFVYHGFTAHELSESPAKIPFEIARIVKNIQPDLVHAITLKYAFFCGLALMFNPKQKRVFTVAGLGYLFSSDGWKPKLLRAAVTPVLRLSFRGAAIILQNPDDQRLLIRSGIINHGTLIRGSGVDINQYNPANNNEETPPVVLFPARLVREKGIAVFVAAARILKKNGVNARFLVAGGSFAGNPNYITQAEMDSLSEGSVVEWLGNVKDMPALYARASLVVYPSWYREGVPKVLLEATSAGKAIITTDHPGCREAVADGVNGILVPVKDAEATANAVEKLLNDPALRAAMGARGRGRAEKEFNVALVVRQTLDVYKTA